MFRALVETGVQDAVLGELALDLGMSLFELLKLGGLFCDGEDQFFAIVTQLGELFGELRLFGIAAFAALADLVELPGDGFEAFGGGY